jgi:hypothetical protein
MIECFAAFYILAAEAVNSGTVVKQPDPRERFVETGARASAMRSTMGGNTVSANGLAVSNANAIEETAGNYAVRNSRMDMTGIIANIATQRT